MLDRLIVGLLTLLTGIRRNLKIEISRLSPFSVHPLNPTYSTVTNVIENYISAFLIHCIIVLNARPLRSVHCCANLFDRLVVIDPDKGYKYIVKYNYNEATRASCEVVSPKLQHSSHHSHVFMQSRQCCERRRRMPLPKAACTVWTRARPPCHRLPH